MKSTICALVLGAGLLSLEAEARPSKPNTDSINPQVRAIVEYVINNPATIVNTEPVYAITSENCGRIGKYVGCSQSGTRSIYNYEFTLNGQKFTIAYGDLDSTKIHSDGKINSEDYLRVFQGRDSPQSHSSHIEFTDRRLDGVCDDSFGVFPPEEYIGLEESAITQKAYESLLKTIGEYISKHLLKK